LQPGRIEEDIPTFGYEVEKRRKKSTVQDARNVANANLIPRFGRETPLYSIDRQRGHRPPQRPPVR
jgi:hypothetical protein